MERSDRVCASNNKKREGTIEAISIPYRNKRAVEIFVSWDDGCSEWCSPNDVVVIKPKEKAMKRNEQWFRDIVLKHCKKRDPSLH